MAAPIIEAGIKLAREFTSGPGDVRRRPTSPLFLSLFRYELFASAAKKEGLTLRRRGSPALSVSRLATYTKLACARVRVSFFSREGVAAENLIVARRELGSVRLGKL